ncbi:MAG: tetratricopeptide repeat protein, partial [Chloroflexota bacterium]
SFFVWGNALSRAGRFPEAKEKFESAIQYANQSNRPLLAAQSYQVLGIDSVYQMEYDTAKFYFERNVAIFQTLDNKAAQAAGLGNLGVLMIYQGNYAAALGYLEQAVKIFQEIGDIRNETIGLINIGSNALKLQDFAKSERFLRQALIITQKTDDLQSHREAHNWLGHLYSDQAKFEDAHFHYEKSLGLARSMELPDYVTETQTALAALAQENGNHEKANQLITEVVNLITLEDLAQADDPIRVFLNGFTVLVKIEPDRANQLLLTGHDHLQKMASQLTDRDLKDYFLNGVPVHKRIMQLKQSN